MVSRTSSTCRFRISGVPASCAFAFLVFACGTPKHDVSLDVEAQRYVRAAVALGERDPDSLDFYSGPPESVADVRRQPPPLSEIKRDALAVAERVTAFFGTPSSSRARALEEDARAVAARVDVLRGTRWSYEQESRFFFDVGPARTDGRTFDDIRLRVAAIVGNRGRLVDRYAEFARRFAVPSDRLTQVFAAALDECRRRTLTHIALPPGEAVIVQVVQNRPWSAYSRYQGGARSVIEINSDFGFTVDQVLQIACHEAYPGHHTRNVLLDASRRDGARWPEQHVQLTFSRASLVSEASAMMAADVAFSAADRVRAERDRLAPLAGVPPHDIDRHIAVERLVEQLQGVQAEIAADYVDGRLEFARAVAAFEERALVPHAEALVKYINEYRSYVTTYTIGARTFATHAAACAGNTKSDERRWKCYEREMMKSRLDRARS